MENEAAENEAAGIEAVPIEINDKARYEQFLEVLRTSIESSNYVASFKILSEARDFVTGKILSPKSYKKLETLFYEKLNEKLKSLGFIDISGKILSTCLWAMVSSGNLALKGPPGVGKSFFAKVILPNLWVYNGVKPHVLTIQPDRNMDIASLVADRGIKKGDTIVEEGQIADAVNLANKGQKVILVLEEINQWPPKVLKDLNDFLEERKLERKIAGKFIKLECLKENLFIIANYNPEGYTLGEDDTGSVSSRFIFCDLPFPSKNDLEKIIEVNISDREFAPTSIGDEVKRIPTKPFLRSMSDICYSIRSSIDAGELGPLAMPIGTRNIINFSKALINNNLITDAVNKSVIDPILEKYVREGPLTNVEPQAYEEYIRTIFKAVKQILGTIDAVNDKDLKSLQKGLNITVSDLFQFQGKTPYEIDIRKGSKTISAKPVIKKLEPVKSEPAIQIETEPKAEELPPPIHPPPKIKEFEIQKPVEEPLKSLESSPPPSSIIAPLLTNTQVFEESDAQLNTTTLKPPEIKKPITSKITPPKKTDSTITELKCLKCETTMSLIVDPTGKKSLICDNPDCRNILNIPQSAEIRIIPKNCKICGSLILLMSRRHGKLVHICPVCWKTAAINGPCEICPNFSKCIGGN